MERESIGRKPTSDDYLYVFIFTILFSVIGVLIFFFTFNFLWIFLSIIPGLMIDALRFGVIVYFSKLPKEIIKEQEKRNV